MLKWIVAACGLLLPSVSMAQGYIRIPTCDTASPPPGVSNGYQDANGKICVNSSVSASISGFTAVTTGTPISVTTGGVTGTLPAGTVVVASNVGATNGAYCKLGATATTADQLIPPSSWFAFTVGASTQLTCITASGTTTVNMTGGAGLPTGSGGGGGGSGGGGAVTVADGADVTQGAKADAKSTATDTTPITIMSVLKQVSASVQAAAASLASLITGQTTGNGSLATIATNSGSAIPAGAALIGKVGIDQTTPGTTNGVQINAALPAGTSLVGNIGMLYPAGSTPLTASSTGTTGATTATLAGTSGKSTYLCGFSIRANATAAATADSTITGTVTGALHYTQWTAPLASGIGLTEQIFAPCVIASATNTGIAVISAAPGAGGVVSVTAWGFQL